MNDEEIREEVVTCIDRRLLDLARDEVVRAINITIQKTRKQILKEIEELNISDKRLTTMIIIKSKFQKLKYESVNKEKRK